jgi:pyruvate formate lyase activating enzyme
MMNRKDFCRLSFLALLALASGCNFAQPPPAAAPGKGAAKGEAAAYPVSALQEAMHYEKLTEGQVRCRVCFRQCLIAPGGVSFCLNRENRDGTLYNLVYGRPSAVHFEPVEKEPLHHFLPGTDILCIGTAGCNFRCKFCHNWHLSQQSLAEIGFYHELDPEAAVRRALNRLRLPSISFTYNEPTVCYEYLYDTARLAVAEGVKVVFHSNGSMNPAALRALLPYVSAVVIDLKAFSEDFYREISQGELAHVLGTLQIIKEEGVWLELVNLVIPGLNDNIGEIRKMCRWINENLGAETPLHFSRFFPAYRLTAVPPTPVETLEAAHAVARAEGLQFVSVGNVPGHIHNSTFCPGCGELLIERVHFTVRAINMEAGRCRYCNMSIPGVWQ